MAWRYPEELRAEVVSAVLDGGMTYTEAARRFGMTDTTVKNWVVAARQSLDAAAHVLKRIVELERRVSALEQGNTRVEQASVHAVKGLAHALKPAIAALLGGGVDQPAAGDPREQARHEQALGHACWTVQSESYGRDL